MEAGGSIMVGSVTAGQGKGRAPLAADPQCWADRGAHREPSGGLSAVGRHRGRAASCRGGPEAIHGLPQHRTAATVSRAVEWVG